MKSDCAYLLVVHGSRSSQYQNYLQKLADLIKQQLKQKAIETELETSYLELAQESLAQKIIKFAVTCSDKGYSRLKILPLFLFSGTHVLGDIPNELGSALDFLGERIEIAVELLPHLGSNDSVIDLLQKKYQKHPTEARIIIIHGTRLLQGKEEAQQVGDNLGARLAFWSMTPFFNTVIEDLIEQGQKSIAILPYFLFPGKITNAIALQTEELKIKYPNIELKVISPLGATEELAQIIVQQLITT